MIMNQLLKKYVKHLLVFIGFLLLSVAYFSPILQGKKIMQSEKKKDLQFKSTCGIMCKVIKTIYI